jgi:hypothetical protein
MASIGVSDTAYYVMQHERRTPLAWMQLEAKEQSILHTILFEVERARVSLSPSMLE